MKELKVALIGAFQAHADKFVRLITEYEESEMAAVWAETPEWKKEHAAIGHCPEADTWEEIIEDKSIDAVIIMSAPRVHAKHILAAANAGKHIYVEKPVCITDEEAQEIREAVHKNGIFLAMADPIYRPQLVYIKHKIDEGAIGPIVNARARIGFPMFTEEMKDDPEALDRIYQLGGAIGDSHTPHMLYFLFGKPLRATAMMQKDASGKIDINTVAVYEFEGGVIGVAEASTRTGGCPYEVEVYGEKGSYRATDKEAFYMPVGGDWEKVPDEELPDPVIYPLKYWVECVTSGRENELYAIDEASLVMAMHNAARKAAEYSVPVEFE